MDEYFCGSCDEFWTKHNIEQTEKILHGIFELNPNVKTLEFQFGVNGHTLLSCPMCTEDAVRTSVARIQLNMMILRKRNEKN